MSKKDPLLKLVQKMTAKLKDKQSKKVEHHKALSAKSTNLLQSIRDWESKKR